MHFLIEYNRRAGQLVMLRSLEGMDSSQSAKVFFELESDRYRRGIDHEVVLLEAEDENALRRNHAHYFSDARELLLRLICLVSRLD